MAYSDYLASQRKRKEFWPLCFWTLIPVCYSSVTFLFSSTWFLLSGRKLFSVFKVIVRQLCYLKSFRRCFPEQLNNLGEKLNFKLQIKLLQF